MYIYIYINDFARNRNYAEVQLKSKSFIFALLDLQTILIISFTYVVTSKYLYTSFSDHIYTVRSSAIFWMTLIYPFEKK